MAWYDAQDSIKVGDVVCGVWDSSTGALRVTVATPEALGVVGLPFGIALARGAKGSAVPIAEAGSVGSAVTGLKTGDAGPVALNAAGRCVRIQEPKPGDALVGTVDAAGVLTVSIIPPRDRLAQNGSGGGILLALQSQVDDLSKSVSSIKSASTQSGNADAAIQQLQSQLRAITVRLENLERIGLSGVPSTSVSSAGTTAAGLPSTGTTPSSTSAAISASTPSSTTPTSSAEKPGASTIPPTSTPTTSTGVGSTTAPVAAAPVGSFKFDGEKSKLVIPNRREVNLAGTVTVEAWIRPTAMRRQNVIGKCISGELTFGINEENDVVFHWGSSGTDGPDARGCYAYDPSLKVTTGQWNHIAAVRDCSNAREAVIRFYLNGELKAERKNDNYPTGAASNNDIVIGGAVYGYNVFEGQIGEVRIWNVARSDADIRGSMSKRLQGTEKGLAALYQMADGEGATKALDASGKYGNAAVTGAVWTTRDAPPITAPAASTGQASSSSGTAASSSSSSTTTASTASPSGTSTASTSCTAASAGSATSGTTPSSSTAASAQASAPLTNGSFRFDGEKSKLVASNRRDVNLAGSLTLEAWVKPTALRRQNVIGKCTSGEFTFGMNEENNVVFHWGITGADGPDSRGSYAYDPNLNVTTGQWNHIAVVRDCSSSKEAVVKLYLNGELKAERRNDNHPAGTVSTNDVVIGGAVYGYNTFEGLISEIRIWTVARSDADIRGSMSKRLRGTESGLAALYQMADGEGATAARDASGKYGNAVVVTAPWTSKDPPPITALADSSGQATSSGSTTSSSSGAAPSSTAASSTTATTASGSASTTPASSSGGSAASTSSGSGTSSSATTSPATASFPTGSFRFDAEKARVVIPNRKDVSLAGTLTLEAWVKPTALRRQNVIGKCTSGEFTFGMNEENNVVFHWGITGADGPDSRGSYAYDPNLKVTTGQWNHIAVVRDCSASKEAVVKLYLNGELKAERRNDNHPVGAVSANDLIIGGALYGYNQFEGQISEVRIWSVARSAEEIRSSMSRRVSGKEPGLAAWYPLADGEGATKAQDGSGRYGDGAITAAFWTRADLPSSMVVRDSAPTTSTGTGTASDATSTTTQPSGATSSTSGSSSTSGASSTTTQSSTGSTSATGSGAASSTTASTVKASSSVTSSSSGVISGTTSSTESLTAAKTATKAPAARQTLTFGGSTLATVPHNAVFQKLGGTYTIELWVRPTVMGGDLVAKGKSTGTDSGDFVLRLSGSNNVSLNYARRGAEMINAYVNKPVAVNEWTHVAVVYDMPGNKIRFYQNGAEVGSGVDPANGCFLDGDFTTQPVTIGTKFKGQISDIRIWGTVRSAKQISASYKQKMSGPSEGLLASWPLDDGAQAATDTSGNGLHGTLTSPAWNAGAPPSAE